MEPTVFISPERGVPSFIWGDTDGENAFEGFAGLVVTESLGLSDDLVREFDAWVKDWQENYIALNRVEGIRFPVWKDGFDSAKWRSDGVVLMHRLQEERPDLDVRNGFDSYFYPTDAATREFRSK